MGKDPNLINVKSKFMKKKFSTWAFLLFFLGLKLTATAANSQKLVTLSVKNCTFKDVIMEMRKQTNMDFIYDSNSAQSIPIVKLNVTSETVSDVLDECLKNQSLTYSIYDNVVVLKQKNASIQDELITIKGKVVDEKGYEIPGVNIAVPETNRGTVSGMDGTFELKVITNDVVVFSFIGYKRQEIVITEAKFLNVQLKPEIENLEEIAVVAFGTQKKESVVSAQSTVKLDDLKTSSGDLTSSFAGVVPGMIAWQSGGLPAAMTEDEMNTKFYIRGITSYQTNANIDPLILMDGIEISKLDLSRLDPDDLESFSVLKDASATAMYGARGANGVILVTTKKGKEGNVYTTFRYEKIWTQPTKEIDVVDPVTYMQMYNEASTGRNPLVLPKYSTEKIIRTASGKYPNHIYPRNDWYNMLFKDVVSNDHYSLNVRGGGQRIQYYSSINYNVDNGMIKADQLNQFDPNIKNKRTTFLTNLNIVLNSTARLVLNSFSSFDDYTGPLQSVRSAYNLAFKASPVDFAAVYPADKQFNWPHVRFGKTETSINPYADIQSGYLDRRRFSTVNKLEYIQDLEKYVKGLEFRAAASVAVQGYFTSAYAYTPAYYKLKDYDHSTGDFSLYALNEEDASSMIKKLNKESVRNSETKKEYQFKALHTASWGDHQTGLTAVYSIQEKTLSSPNSLVNSLPRRNLGVSMRGNYGYKDRYFVEGSFGYNGSERFAKNNRFGFFPAVGGAWVASKENWMQGGIKDYISFLKLRLSYGQVGNDGVINDPRFLYLETIYDTGSGPKIGSSGRGEDYYYFQYYANRQTKWEVAETVNLGLEIKLFKDLFDANVDIYQEIRHNIYDYRTTLPATLGLAEPPLDNVGSTKSRGIDFSGKIQKSFTKDFYTIINGTFTYNKTTFLDIEEPSNRPEWQTRKGKEISQRFGYIAEGLFQDQAEIDNSAFQAGDVMPGDIKYRDINGDNKIDRKDCVSIGNPETPRIIYGFNGFVGYKNFEFGMAFQGSGKRSFWIDPEAVSPFDGNKALLTAIANDHWSEANQAEKPLWPRLSTQNITVHNPQENFYEKGVTKEEVRSTYFMKDCSFLRCTKIELGYYLPKKMIEKCYIKKAKIYARVSNPFIISDFDIWDVELGSSGFNYPIQKTFTLGASLSF